MLSMHEASITSNTAAKVVLESQQCVKANENTSIPYLLVHDTVENKNEESLKRIKYCK